jgi:uncharacterized oligopeptide transporter (OPT) family protein
VAGVVLTLIKHFWKLRWVPSATGFGFGLILPGTLIIPVALGGVCGWVWEKTNRPSYDRYVVTVASGLIAGEALLGGLVMPVVNALR